MRNALFALGITLALAGCVTPSQPGPPPGGDGLVWARIGQTVNVGGPRVTPLALLEDSRCPVGVQCVWAGRVRISARIATGGGSSVRELTMSDPVRVADGTLELSAVDPASKPKTAVPARRYRFGFHFAGGL